MKKSKLLFINPAATHPVFLGWLKFFDKYFDFTVAAHGTLLHPVKHFINMTYKLLRIGKNFIIWYDSRQIPYNPHQMMIVGDTFTNPLCYILPGQKILYSEYFNKGKALWKKLFFRGFAGIFLRNRKFLLPTPLAYQTFSQISRNCLYIPIIYNGPVVDKAKKNNKVIQFLFIGRICNKYKNIFFLIDNIIRLHQQNNKVRLVLVGELFEKDLLEKYKEAFEKGIVSYLGKIAREETMKIRQESDIFVLASDSDPIGAVILESMAQGCAILVSDTCGASGYIKNGENGLIFKTNDNNDFEKKALELITSDKKLLKMRETSIQIVKEYYDIKNKKVIENYYKQLIKFISS